MMDFLQRTRSLIKLELKKLWLKKKKELAGINRWGDDMIHRTSGFVAQGKMIRGGLVMLSYVMYKKKITPSVLTIATAMELVHSSLLIHDDIMDQDILRRGHKTIYAQFTELGQKEKFKDPGRFGESMAICVGDILFFFAFELMSSITCPEAVKKKIMTFWSKEISWVGLGQMEDVYFGITKRKIKEQDILNLYRFKTARYTFSLPMVLGAMLAQKDHATIRTLEALGENLGLIFQIKDDELGLFGYKKDTGKPVGSDIKEEKKTLFSHYLLQKVKKAQLVQLKKIFGNKKMTYPMIKQVRALMNTSGTLKLIRNKITALEKETKHIIKKLRLPVRYKNEFFKLLQYSVQRKS